MLKKAHDIHIPVMGTGHSADTAIRVAPFGISSVISLVDDLLLEKLRKFYNERYNLPYTVIPRSDIDGRSKRITAYLETVKHVVDLRFNEIKAMPFFEDNDKAKYFNLLPDYSDLKKMYDQLVSMTPGTERSSLEQELTENMTAGSIDVNIMVKLDAEKYDKDGNNLGPDYTDAKTALKGFAESSLRSNIIFSAGINQTLFTYMTRFKDFYRDASGDLKKKIIVKVSDFRSALIQGKFLAKKGLEVSEFRIESGLNCGGHAFPSNGTLLGPVMKEFKEQREKLTSTLMPIVKKYYDKIGLEYTIKTPQIPLVTVQGGIGVFGEIERLKSEYGVDNVGVGTPFLFVPEATPIDEPTLDLLISGDEETYYLSDASPVGVQFNNLKDCGSQKWAKEKINEGKPGSSCPKGFLVNNTEFTERPICVASTQYQTKKLEQIATSDLTESEKAYQSQKVLEKECICHYLGNGSLLKLDIEKKIERAPQSICPGPNGAWFTDTYTLKEMLDHFYGRTPSIIASERPHMFSKEISMYVKHFQDQAKILPKTGATLKTLQTMFDNLNTGMEYCLEIADKEAFKDENLGSIKTCVSDEQKRLADLFDNFKESLSL